MTPNTTPPLVDLACAESGSPTDTKAVAHTHLRQRDEWLVLMLSTLNGCDDGTQELRRECGCVARYVEADKGHGCWQFIEPCSVARGEPVRPTARQMDIAEVRELVDALTMLDAAALNMARTINRSTSREITVAEWNKARQDVDAARRRARAALARATPQDKG